eukprot:TRINITY_DN990_c0_g1_i1.p1 TRINITY_DN990_c0_g1~~TRINITY_DN990_c0_g1_i1.p1  ORF type:complete len:789 (-),score=124.73 TRINITY_DN990_c0_g1_i1:26-2368(-)
MQTDDLVVSVNENQKKLCDASLQAIDESAGQMMMAIEANDFKETIRFAIQMTNELRNSLLQPIHYGTLFVSVLDHLQVLSRYLEEEIQDGMSIEMIYQYVQYTGNIVPRLYLLFTVGALRLTYSTVSKKEVLKDMSTLVRGVQHPTHGLFLRYYLVLMTRACLPDATSSDPIYGGIEDSIDFLIVAFTAMSNLFSRLANIPIRKKYTPTQVIQELKEVRERERSQLTQLLGTSLNVVSNLNGLTPDFYKTLVLPKLMDEIVFSADSLLQQYLLECIVMRFSDFHISTFNEFFNTCKKVEGSVDLSKIISEFLEALTLYLMENKSLATEALYNDVKNHLLEVIEVQETIENESITKIFNVFCEFTFKLYGDSKEHIDETYSLLFKQFEGRKLNRATIQGIEKVITLAIGSFSSGSEIISYYSIIQCYSLLPFIDQHRICSKFIETMLSGPRLKISSDEYLHLVELLNPYLGLPTIPDDWNDEGIIASDSSSIGQVISFFDGNIADIIGFVKFFHKQMKESVVSERLPYLLPVFIARMCEVAILEAKDVVQDEKNEEPHEEADASDSDSDTESKAKPVPDGLKKIFRYTAKLIKELLAFSPKQAVSQCLLLVHLADSIGYLSLVSQLLDTAFLYFEEESFDKNDLLIIYKTFTSTICSLKTLDEENRLSICSRMKDLTKRVSSSDKPYALGYLSYIYVDFNEKRCCKALQQGVKQIVESTLDVPISMLLFLFECIVYHFKRGNTFIKKDFIDGVVEEIETRDADENSEEIARVIGHFKSLNL